MYSKRQWHFLFTALPAAALLAAPATAQIVTDGSLGRGTVTLTGRNVDIAPALGEMHGGNLFHSFRTFSVNPGQSATFVGPDSVRNVISRVTGGEPSRIDGVLRSTVGQADFYFINPSGIAFGPNARVDVPGSLHVGTAHELRFADGSTFSADLSAKSTLTTAPPEAFGFLDRPSGPLTVDRSVLSVDPGKTFTLAGGGVDMAGSTIGTAGGAVQVASVSSAGSVGVRDAATRAGALGPVRLSGQARLDTEGDGGGTIRIRGGQLLVVNSTLDADNTGDAAATGGIDVRVAGGLGAAGGLFQSRSFGAGSGGTISVEAGDMVLTGQSFLDASSGAGGNSGNIQVTGRSLRLSGRSVVSTETFGSGSAGDLRIGVGYLSANNSFIGAGSSGTADTATAGTVEITADAIEFRNEGRIFNGTTGPGGGGDVFITTGSLLADGRLDHFARNHTGIASTVEAGAGGRGGDISVNARDITLLNRGMITAGTQGTGAAGTITINTGSLMMPRGGQILSESGGGGPGGQIAVTADRMELSGGSVVSAEALASGPGGSITLGAGHLSVNNSFIGTSTSGGAEEADAGSVTVSGGAVELRNEGRIFNGTSGPGDGGIITIHADSLLVDGALDHENRFATGIGSSVERGPGGRDASGHGGSIHVDVRDITLLNEGMISAGTRSIGPAGAVRIEADRLRMPERGLVLSESAGDGPGGEITVTAGRIELAGRSVLSAEALASGPGGSITINAGHLSANNSFIGASTSGGAETADAGPVAVTAGSIELRNEGRIFNGTSGPGDGGNITIHADSLLADGALDHENRFATGLGSSVETGGKGRGGDIDVDARDVTLLNLGEISASTEDTGNAGAINVAASSVRVAGGEITADTAGGGRGGSIRISADRVDVTGGGMLFAGTGGPSAGGDIDVDTGVLSVTGSGATAGATPDRTDDPTGLFTNVTSSGSGAGGTVRLTAGEISVSRGGAISAQTAGSGPAGNVAITAAGTLSLDGGIVETAVADPLEGTPEQATERTTGGDLSVTAENIRLSGGSELASRSVRGPGQAGKITVASRRGLLSRASVITTQALQGDGGDILLSVGYLLDLVDSAVTTRVESGQGNGGNITIGPPPFVVLDRSSIIANASGGNGGNIGIRAGQLISTPDSLIQASSELGIAGNIAIDAPQNDIGGALAILPGTFLDGAALLAETCASRSGKPSSSLVAGGRGGLPPDPEQPLSLGRQADPPKAAPPNAPAPVTGAAGRNRTPAVSSLGLQPACPG